MVWLESRERSLYVQLHDLSLGGLGLRVPTCLRRGQRMELELALPDGGAIAGRVVVAWVRGGVAPGAGLKLVAISDPERWQLLLGRPPISTSR